MSERSRLRVLLWLLPALACLGEVLKNPGFDADADGDGLPDHWSTTHERVRWREKVFMGQDYELISKPDQYVLATQRITLKKGQRYTLVVKCRGEAGGVAGALIVHGEERPHREMPLLWNLEPAAEYSEYARTFVAPNPVAVLYIYNIARTKGTVYYDHVSLREGEPDRLFVGRLSFKQIDRPLSAPLETRHIDWASPLAGGPVKTFATLRVFRCLRQVLELAQRIDLDYDVVHTGYQGDECVSETGPRVTDRLKQDYYEVYVVSSRITDLMADTIRERVERGAGLVVIEGFGRASRLLKPDGLREVDDAHYVRRGVPWEMMPEKILDSVQVGELGAGRVVRLVFPIATSRVWGMLPTENSLDAYRSREFEYWEWWQSLFAKAIVWSARRDGSTRAAPAGIGSDALTLRVEGAPAGSKVRVGWRSAREIRFAGPLLRTPAAEQTLSPAGRTRFVVPAELPAGVTIADAMVLNPRGEVLDWGSHIVRTPQFVQLQELATDGDTYEPGSVIRVTARACASESCKATFEASLVDAFGRQVSSAAREVELSSGQHSVELTCAVRDPIAVHHKLFVRVLVGGKEQDSLWRTVLAPAVGPARAASDFTAMPWAPGMTHPVIGGMYVERVQELGLNAEFARRPFLVGENGMPSGVYFGGMGGAFRETEYSSDGVRSTCLSDPAVMEELKGKVRESAAQQRSYGVFAAGIGDEVFLTSRHKRHEVCFGEHCQQRYRQWLRVRYGSVAALNAQWGSAHASWDEIVGVRTEDARQLRNFGPFVDFRTFMTEVWIEACRSVTDAYHDIAPDVPVGHTNTFGANPFNGNDYWALCTRTGFGWGQEYSEAIKASGHKAVFDLWRSFVDTPEARRSRTAGGGQDHRFFNYGWIGYDHRVAAAHYEPWWLALHGARGVSYFATNAIDAARGVSWALVYPTLSLTGYSMAVKEALTDLRNGVGKVFLEFEREQPRIALLWSHASMLVAWCESQADDPVPNERDGTDSYGTYFRSALHFRQHVNELQLDYSYVAPEQVVSTDILSRYPLLFLPFTVAASDALIERLDAYVANGGVLVGDLRCLRTDEHGKPVADSAYLRRLFGVTRADDVVVYESSKVSFSERAQGLDVVGIEAEGYGRERLSVHDAMVLGRHSSGEPALMVRSHGKGLAVYLNFSLPAYSAVVRTLVEQLAARAGVGRHVVVEAVSGDAPPRCYERNTFTRGGADVHAFIRDHRRCSDSDPVRIRFGRAAHVYEMRVARYLGETDQVEATVAPGDTVLYSCLPYRATGLELSLPETVVQGQIAEVRVRVVVDPAKAPGDHVFHLDMTGPDGVARRHYARNVLAPGGVLAADIRLAENEQIGRWTVALRDVLTGVSGEATFEVTSR